VGIKIAELAKKPTPQEKHGIIWVRAPLVLQKEGRRKTACGRPADSRHV